MPGGRRTKAAILSASMLHVNEDDAEAMLPDKKDPLGYPPEFWMGRPNIWYWRVRYNKMSREGDRALAAGERPTINVKDQCALILQGAELSGFKQADVLENRLPSDIYRDVTAKLLDAPQSIWEVPDHELKIVEERMEEAVRMVDGEMHQLSIDAMSMGAKEEAQRRKSAGKAMLSRIRRVMRLREIVRDPLSNPIDKHALYEKDAHEAAWPLLLMLYCGRSQRSVPEGKNGLERAEYEIFAPAAHHAVFALDTWRAYRKVGIQPGTGKIIKGCQQLEGIVMLAPPGHGKTEFAMWYTILWYSLKPETMGVYLHRVDELAASAVNYIGAAFTLDNANGRRRATIFPNAEALKVTNGEMWLKTNRVMKDPSLKAHGIMSARLGIGTSFQVRDDIVRQEESPTERERVCKIMGGTWDSRQRFGDTFAMNIGTMWHPADALAKMVDNARAGRVKYLISIQRAGGPNTRPAFAPLWPAAYPAAVLRGMYHKVGHATYCCAYMSDPRVDELKMVSDLALYDPETVEHQQFMLGAITHLSVDPAATTDEKNDKCALSHAAVGDLTRDLPDGSRTIITKMRFLSCQQFHNTVGMLVDTIAEFAAVNRTDYVYIETKTGFKAVPEWMKEKYGVECVYIEPGDKSKERRLRRVAGVMDAGMAKRTGQEVVVEFPGVKTPDGGLTIDPRYKEFYEQIVNFGASGEFGVVDTVTQLVWKQIQAGAIPTMGGEVTMQVQQAKVVNEKMRAILAGLNTDKTPRSAEDQETQFLKENSGWIGPL